MDKAIIRCVGFVIIYSNLALANVSHDLDKVFNSLGQNANITEPHHYNGQRAGYYTGGSVYARNSVRQYSLAHVQMPEVKAGCGGIDLYTGGFSFINSKEIQDALKNIANNAAGYSFLLGLETMSPLIKNQMLEMQKMANTINSLNINSCQSASMLVGGLWPQTNEASSQICETIASSNNHFSDRVAARHGCSDPAKRAQIMANGKSQSKWADLIADNTNIAWAALQKQSVDRELSEFLLSLSGSIIVTDKSGPQPLPSLINNASLLPALLEGGETTLYRCDNAQHCLNPTVQKLNIPADKGLKSHVEATLQRLLNNIQSDTSLSSKDIQFLESVSLPVYKMLNVEAAFYGGSGVLNLVDYADVIALDLLFTYLNENLEFMSNSALAMQYPAPIVKEYQSMLHNAKRAVSERRSALMRKKTVNTQLVEKTQMLEKMLAGELTAELAAGER